MMKIHISLGATAKPLDTELETQEDYLDLLSSKSKGFNRWKFFDELADDETNISVFLSKESRCISTRVQEWSNRRVDEFWLTSTS
jgi:hypothetical protein